jgi:hypothetical protein
VNDQTNQIRAGSAQSCPVGVASAVVFRDASMTEVLLGVRRTTPLVRRHPGVLSTLTIGVPKTLFNLLAPAAWADMPPGVHGVTKRETLLIGSGGYLRSPASFVIEHLLAYKVGLASALAMGAFRATGELWAISLDNVADPLGTEEDEWTAMLTYALTVEQGVNEIPSETKSYSRFIWSPIAPLREAIVTRDPLKLDLTLNPFEVCIHGLCVRSILNLLDELIVDDRH